MKSSKEKNQEEDQHQNISPEKSLCIDNQCITFDLRKFIEIAFRAYQLQKENSKQLKRAA